MKNFKLYRIPIPEFVKLYNELGDKVTVVTVEQERTIGRTKYRIPSFYIMHEKKREEVERLMLEVKADCGLDFYSISQNPYLVLEALEQLTLCKLGKDEEFDESVLDFDFAHSIYYDKDFLDNAFRIFVTKMFDEGEELDGLGEQYLKKSDDIMRLCLERKK